MPQRQDIKFVKSKFTIGILFSFLVGIFASNWLSLDLWWLIGITLGLIGGLALFWQDILRRFIFFCLLGLFLGLFYSQLYSNLQNSKRLIYDQKIEIQGQIVAPIQIKPIKTQAILAYEKTKILVDLPRYPEYQFGDVLSFSAEITDPKSIKPFDGFDYGRYLLDKNIRGIVKKPENIVFKPTKPNLKVWFGKKVYQIGESFQNSLFKVLPEPYASFQAGLLLGNRVTSLPDSLTSAFNRTGTTHIVAVSGYNVTIIISLLAVCFGFISRRFSFWATLSFILIFIILTGGSASVIRAGILGGLVVLGKLEGRRINHLILILLVANLMLLFNPHQIRGDVGFQLSFLAFAGLIYISPLISNLRILAKLLPVIKTISSETLAAQIAVLPILIYNFGLISLVAPLTNILVLPIIPLSMLSGFVTGLGGLIWLWLGKILALFSLVLLKYTILIVETFSRFSWAAISFKSNEWWWIVIYYLLIFILVIKNKKNNQSPRSNYQ